MATATLAPVRSFDSLPAATQRNATAIRLALAKQRRLEGVAELAQNGIIVSNVWEDGEAEPELMQKALNCKQMSGCEDFQSAPDAKPMAPQDIANVQTVGRREIGRAMVRIARKYKRSKAAQTAYDAWEANEQRWRDDDVRWTLSPHQLQKVPAKSKKK